MLRHTVLAAVVLVLVAGTVAVAADSESYTDTFAFSGGYAFCSFCGASRGAYACSPDDTHSALGAWKNGELSFDTSSELGSNVNVQNITLTLSGVFNCNPSAKTATIRVQLNGVSLDFAGTSLGLDANNCKCGSCSPDIVLSASYPEGVPKYNYNAPNTLLITPVNGSSYFCLTKAVVSVGYSKTDERVFDTSFQELSWPGSSNTPVCYLSGQGNYVPLNYYQQTQTLSFNDTTPYDAVVVGARITIFYAYNQMNCNGQNTTVKVMMQNINVANVTAVYSSTASPLCSGHMSAYTGDNLYAEGWPNFVKGGSNTLTFQAVDSSCYSYGSGVQLGLVQVELLYYTPETFSRPRTETLTVNFA